MRRPGRPTRAGAQFAGRPKRICTTGSSRFRTSTCRGAKRTCEECATMHDRFDDSIAAAENWVSVAPSASSDCAALSSPRCSRPPTPDIFQRSRAAAHPFEYQGHEAFVASQQVRCSRGRLPRRQSQLPKVCAPHRPAFRRVNASLYAKAPPAAGSGPVAWVLPPSPHPTRFVTILESARRGIPGGGNPSPRSPIVAWRFAQTGARVAHARAHAAGRMPARTRRGARGGGRRAGSGREAPELTPRARAFAFDVPTRRE